MKTIVVVMFLITGFSEVACMNEMDELERLVYYGKDAELDEYLKHNRGAFRGRKEHLVDICLDHLTCARASTLEILLKHGACPQYLPLDSFFKDTYKHLLLLYGADPTGYAHGGPGLLGSALSNFIKNTHNLTTICTMVVLRDVYFEYEEKELKNRTERYAKWLGRILNAPRIQGDPFQVAPDTCLEIAGHVFGSQRAALSAQIARWQAYKRDFVDDWQGV